MNVLNKIYAPILAAAMLVAGMTAVQAGELVNALPDGVAMDGFDVVAYHTTGAPAAGSASHPVE